MTKTARRLAFALEPPQPFGVAAHFRWQHLDRDAITEQDMARAIHRAHAATTEQCFDLILAIKHTTDERVGIFFQHLAVFGAEAYVVVVLVSAGGTKLHEWGKCTMPGKSLPSASADGSKKMSVSPIRSRGCYRLLATSINLFRVLCRHPITVECRDQGLYGTFHHC